MNPPVKKAKKNKAQAKSTPPDAVTCINTYFRVINVYMCNKHRSDVLRLGQPPTLAELDARRFRHKFISIDLLSHILMMRMTTGPF